MIAKTQVVTSNYISFSMSVICNILNCFKFALYETYQKLETFFQQSQNYIALILLETSYTDIMRTSVKLYRCYTSERLFF